MSRRCDDSDVLEKKITAGVYRGEMRAEAGVSALYQNIFRDIPICRERADV